MMHEGNPPAVITAIVEGLAFRRRTTPGGKRQITAIVVSGYVCGLFSPFFSRAGYGIEAVIDCEVATAKRQDVLALIAACPNLGRALW